MRKNDRILFTFPAIAVAVTVVFAGLFYWQMSRFKEAYRHDAEENIVKKTSLLALVLQPMLDNGQLVDAVKLCADFDRHDLRVSLIDNSGRVAADSAENAADLDNHGDRAEVRAAMEGTPRTVTRYSESLNKWMIYHAVLLKSPQGDFVLRTAITTDAATRILDLAQLGILLALLFGGALAFLLASYIFLRIRRPLAQLLDSTELIARGDFDTEIEIPTHGVVRELAFSVFCMTEKLKNQLDQVTTERNEKEAILNSMSDAVLLFSADGEVLKYNRCAELLFGLKQAGERFRLTRCGVTGLHEAARKALTEGTPIEGEFKLPKGRAEHTLFIKGGILSETRDRFLLLTITDLTNLRKLESFRSDFVANVSHEIRTPLTCIIGAAETIREEPNLNKEQQKKLADILFEQSTRLNSLVQDILSLAALERRQLNPTHDFAVFGLDSMLETAVELCRNRAAESRIALNITAAEPIEINGDCQLLTQAVTNLINNAILYSKSEKIDVSLRKQGNEAVIEVKDYGIGIAEENQGRIFERFYRVHKERSRQLGGTGLGLAIVKHAAQLHEGRAELESQPDEGCSFRILLPIA